MLAWCGTTWLLYSVLSNNMGGCCCSVRWFVPFLSPGFWWLAIVLRDRPERRPEFLAFAIFGAILAAIMWWKGPFTTRMVPMMWPIVGAALLAWGIVHVRAGRRAGSRRPSENEDRINIPDREASSKPYLRGGISSAAFGSKG